VAGRAAGGAAGRRQRRLDLGAGTPAASLRASDFELLRAVMGRRSRAQLLALDWDADAEPYVDHLHIFGPAATDVVE
jgi:hypothetical protein